MAKGQKTGGRDWVKGQSGNPKGGSKSRSITEHLRNQLMETVSTTKGSKITRLQAICEVLFQEILINKNMTALKLLMNYVDGLPEVKIDVQGMFDINADIELSQEDEKIYAENVRQFFPNLDKQVRSNGTSN